MIKMVLLGDGRIAELAVSILTRPKYANVFQISTIVTSKSFFESIKKNNPNIGNPEFISNHDRNTEKILSSIESLGITHLLSIQHVWILSPKILDSLNGQCFNLHNAKLPNYKGHASISHAINLNDKHFTTTIHWMVPKVDSGPIAFEETVEIEPNETAYSLYHKTLVSAEKVLQLLLDAIPSNEVPKRSYDEGGHYYNKSSLDKLRDATELKDFTELERRARALYFPPYEPAYKLLDGRKIYLLPESGLQLIDVGRPANRHQKT